MTGNHVWKLLRGIRPRRPSGAGTLATALLVLAAMLNARAARACSPWAERLLTWDAAVDAAVVAIWTGPDRPPRPLSRAGRAPSQSLDSAVTFHLLPEQYELRAISTGRVLANIYCEPEGGKAATPDVCDWQGAFAKHLPAAHWGRGGPPVQPGMLRVRASRSPQGRQDFALEGRTDRSWKRVLWLDAMAKGNPERRRYRLGESQRIGGNLILALEQHSIGGNCAHTRVQVLALPEQDVADPGRPGRHARLLAATREDMTFAYWRTVAELGPLPTSRLLDAMEAAEVAGEPSLAARWWRSSIAGVPPAQRAALEVALRARPGLLRTRDVLERPATP